MKYLLSIVTILLILVVAAGGLFIVLFDPNPLRPQIESYLEQEFAVDAKIGYLSLSRSLDFGISAESFIVRRPGDGELLFKTDKARFGVDLRGLLRREFILSELILRSPQIYVKKIDAREWNWPEKALKWAKNSPQTAEKAGVGDLPQKSKSSPEKPNLWNIQLKEIRIEEGRFYYGDFSQQRPFEVDLRNLDARIFQTSSKSPIELKAKGSLLHESAQDSYLELKHHLDVETTDFSFVFGDDIIEIQGSLKSAGEHPVFNGKIDIHQLDLEEVTPELYKQHEYLSGILTGHLEGSVQGFHPDLIKQNLKMKGYVDIRNGAFKNINFVERVLKNLTPVPAIGQMLIGQIPEELAPVIQGEDTPFEQLQSTISIANGLITAEETNLKHEDFLITAQGTYGLIDSSVYFDLRLILLERISEFLVKKIHELSAVKNRQGRIVLPFKFRGNLLKSTSVQPDLSVVTRSIVKEQGSELIQKGLEELSKYL